MALILKKKKVKLIANPFADIPDPFGYGQRAVDFLRSLKHPKSRHPDRDFQLDPWQERIVRQIYGPCDEHGGRIIRNVVIMLPRGNRKTSLGAALSLLHTMGPEAVPGGEVLTAAADRKQAKLAFTEAQSIIQAGSEELWRKGQASRRFEEGRTIKLQEYKNRMTFPNGSFLESLSNDAGTQHGRTPVFALIDEIHAWKKRDLWDVIRTGLVKVPNSLSIVITTAGRGQENIAFEVIDYARKVAAGKVHDPATLPILFETSPDADWQDEEVWKACNPGLIHGYPDLNGLRQLAREAAERPADREAFRQLHLNIWLGHSSDPFVDMPIYDKGAGAFDLEELEHEPCWLAVDLSSNSDLTVIVAAWRDGQDGYIVHPWFFCPRDNLDKRADRDGVPYPQWAGEGFIEPTFGNVVDFRVVEDTIRELCERFEVREIAFDPHLGRVMMSNLADDGYPAIEMRQGWVTMAPAIKELERAIIAGRFRHGGHPVLRWNFDNIAVETDKAGNKAFHKGKSRDRIDGAVAAAMAVGRASLGEDNRSIYDTEDRPEGLLVF
ncbi:terminase large subunit [Neorhizobium galegae]|uniref:Putative phage terminase, large subunit n=1 Tax=Neorhizobium galegae bv. officinalis TaxID=323656 RepID=A0A0T7H1L3_NEOGA|nr:terminase TerL endonuclease subunit [Neorhizobium galegae]CDZ53368.1 Putative phage terminase, large subunit [Neorhizobium galegae bv. officinalis]